MKHLIPPSIPSDVKQDSNEQLKTPGYQFSASKESKHVTLENSSHSAMPLLVTL